MAGLLVLIVFIGIVGGVGYFYLNSGSDVPAPAAPHGSTTLNNPSPFAPPPAAPAASNASSTAHGANHSAPAHHH